MVNIPRMLLMFTLILKMIAVYRKTMMNIINQLNKWIFWSVTTINRLPSSKARLILETPQAQVQCNQYQSINKYLVYEQQCRLVFTPMPFRKLHHRFCDNLEIRNMMWFKFTLN